MTPLAASNEQTAIDFYNACMVAPNEKKLQVLTSEGFSASCKWNYGKRVEWSNFQQFIGGFKLGVWTKERTDCKVLSFLDGALSTSHFERNPSEETAKSIRNLWAFTFKADGEIDSVTVETTVR